MILKYPNNTTQDFIEIESQLKTLSLAFNAVENQTLSNIILEDGEQQIIGKKAIIKHLDELSEELEQWYYCNC